MKIGILTLPLHTNYGGILQAYALQTVLERMGHQAELIMKKLHPEMLKVPDAPTAAEARIMWQHTDRFIDRYIRGAKSTLAEVSEGDYDAFVVGSDQVWRYLYVSLMGIDFEDVFLRFAEGWDVKRVSYAPSFGLDTWEAPAEMVPGISRLLHRFNAVSVRESSGVALCRDLLGVEATHVVDPTLLLGREDYDRLTDAVETDAPQGDLMCYVLDETEEKSALIDAVSGRYGLTPFRANSKVERPDAPLEERIQPPLEQWLRSFRDAKMVITDSFHATVFSIIYGKPFIVTGNPGRGLARMQSFLSLLEAEDHMVVAADGLDTGSDYSVADKSYRLLAAARQQSLHFLQEAVGKNERKLSGL